MSNIRHRTKSGIHLHLSHLFNSDIHVFSPELATAALPSHITWFTCPCVRQSWRVLKLSSLFIHTLLYISPYTTDIQW